jgi:acyl-coenzyme A thioesterase PaaI-like protein
VGAYQYLFYNASTHKLVNVIYLGAATTGWPGVVHGGVIATILDETCGRVAVREFPSRTGVTARLKIDYRGMTFANGFYVIRAQAVREEELADGERGKRDRKVVVSATLEDLKGRVCAQAEALFVVPKDGMGLARIGEHF